MRIIANIGFIISLIILSIITPFNLINIFKNPNALSIVISILTVAIAVFLWALTIRSLRKHKTFLYFSAEPKQTGKIDTSLIEEALAEEIERLKEG